MCTVHSQKSFFNSFYFVLGVYAVIGEKECAEEEEEKNRYKRIEDRIEDRQYTLYTARGMILIYGKPP
jgi:hypothetical protein